ncbi:MAG: tetratricopeptide repeat protein [Ignavibacteriales bacterium]|nr:tetratricopeptide repeat protein [Ignavibacteriales bacterium]
MLPSDFDSKRSEGEQLFLHGKFAEALAVFADLLQTNPSNPTLNFWYGASLIKLGHSEQAIKHFYLKLEADGNNATVLNFLAAQPCRTPAGMMKRFFNLKRF